MTGRRIGGAVVLGALVLGALVWAVVVQSPLFEVRRIEVRGLGRLAREDVSALLPGVEGRNLLLLSLDRVERMVGTNPWVDRVEARRQLPSTLVVRIREHVPVAWVRGPSGGVALSSRGVVLGRRRTGRGLVSLGRVSEATVAGSPAPVEPGLVRVVASLAPRVRREVAAARIEDEGIVLRTRSGARILLGDPVAIPAKAATLQALLRWMGEHGVPAGMIDLRAPATPAIRPVPGSTGAPVSPPAGG